MGWWEGEEAPVLVQRLQQRWPRLVRSNGVLGIHPRPLCATATNTQVGEQEGGAAKGGGAGQRLYRNVRGNRIPTDPCLMAPAAEQEYKKEELPEKSIKSFCDVRGCDEAKEELHEVVEFLKNPKK